MVSYAWVRQSQRPVTAPHLMLQNQNKVGVGASRQFYAPHSSFGVRAAISKTIGVLHIACIIRFQCVWPCLKLEGPRAKC